MIRLARHIDIPYEITVACSGGPDSMAVVDFLDRGSRTVRVAHFNHGTEHGKLAEGFVRDYWGDKRGLEVVVGRTEEEKPPEKSPEEHWRDQRYRFLDGLGDPVITAHHLDDVVETWIFSCLHGQGKLIPWRRNKVIRPFLMTEKQELTSWCARKKVPFLTDPSNQNTRYMRNLIRREIVPLALKVNPGIRKTIHKKLMAKDVQKAEQEEQVHRTAS